jgi:predicted dinucleotide-binding enzyme
MACLAAVSRTVFVSGNDAAAKQTVTELLKEFGHQDVIDLGDISTARGTEMLLPVWLRLWEHSAHLPSTSKSSADPCSSSPDQDTGSST